MTEVARANDALAALAACDLTAMSGHEGVDLLSQLSTAMNTLNAVRLTTLAVVADSGVWALDGSRSCAAWLSRLERSTRAGAGGDLKTARGLVGHLPLTVKALAEGSLPVGHARALTRACLRTERLRDQLTDPDRGEGFLLSLAHLDLTDYRKALDSWVNRADPMAADTRYRDDKGDCFLRLSPTTGGSKLDGFLDPVGAEALLVALKAEIGVPAAGDLRGTGRRMHDALVSLAMRALSSGTLGVLASVKPHIVVNVNYDTVLATYDTLGMAPPELQETGVVITRRELDRLMCDSQVTRVIFGPQGEVLDVGRSQRTFTGPRRRALDAHDGGCVYPGCDLPPCQCEGHHTRDGGWAGGATTNTDEGCLLCYHHHPYVHDHDITIHRNHVGDWVFTDRWGLHLGTTRPRTLRDDLWTNDPWNQTA